jgi:hypothetical protein
MLYSDEELQGKINDFMRRKKAKYPGLTDIPDQQSGHTFGE